MSQSSKVSRSDAEPLSEPGVSLPGPCPMASWPPDSRPPSSGNWIDHDQLRTTAANLRTAGRAQSPVRFGLTAVEGGPHHLLLAWMCGFLGLPVVQDLCEWWPGEPTCSSFTRWLYRKRLFASATGALVISKVIENRTRERSVAVNPQLMIHHLPNIV